MAYTYLERGIPGTRMAWRGTHQVPQEKPKNPKGNPTFGTPPLEKRSFSILDDSHRSNI
jgi:hypothetical protein